MAYLKFGFHTGGGGIGVPRSFYEELDVAGIPFFAKSADAFPFDAQVVAAGSNVPHTVVYRRSVVPAGAVPPPSGNPDVPDYNKTPAVAAAEHWAWHLRHLPPELDPTVTWIETINEPDKRLAEWLADFAYETAVLALRDGYKWAAFGWSTGEPEPEHWRGARMLRFLDYVANNPHRLAIALHEYSLDVHDITAGGGYLVGRFRDLLRVNSQVPILITEWGWTLWDVPDPATAVTHYDQAGMLYAAYPQVRGAATWYLGGGWQGIAQQAQRLIAPLKEATLTKTYPDPVPPRHTAVVVKAPQEATADEWQDLAAYAYQFRHTMTASEDDTVTVLRGGNATSYAKVYAPSRPSQVQTIRTLEALGLNWQELTLESPPDPPPTTRLDLLRYILPDADYGPMFEVQHGHGPTETFQMQRAGGNNYYLVKNSQWEEFMDYGGYIWRGRDTSPGPAPSYAERPGDLRWYRQFEDGRLYARWCPRYMAIGETWEGPGHHVQFYYKSDCAASSANSGPAVNRITLTHHHVSKTWNGITVQDVVELTNGVESWFYAYGIGMVAWMGEGGADSAISEWHDNRPNLTRESGCFS